MYREFLSFPGRDALRYSPDNNEGEGRCDALLGRTMTAARIR